MNLCTNAAHAMHKKGGTLRMSMAAVPADMVNIDVDPKSETDLFLKLTVGDTGHGMDRRTSERIFDPYFTTKPVGEGTGLGLSVVHGVVKSLGGHIAVESEPGKGSNFTIFIPIIKAQAVPKLETREPIPTGSEHILFVDDEKPLAILGRRMLERLGYNVTVETDSLKALEVFRSQTDDFDLVITDMTMPGMTGEKLAVELLRINPQIPIILCTGYSDLVSETMAKNLGIREYILKPIVIRDMANALRRALEPAE
jgi:CheY-like chemotaxis protein